MKKVYRFKRVPRKPSNAPSKVLSLRVPYVVWAVVKKAIDDESHGEETMSVFLSAAVLDHLADLGYLVEVDDEDTDDDGDSEGGGLTVQA